MLKVYSIRIPYTMYRIKINIVIQFSKLIQWKRTNKAANHKLALVCKINFTWNVCPWNVLLFISYGYFRQKHARSHFSHWREELLALKTKREAGIWHPIPQSWTRQAACAKQPAALPWEQLVYSYGNLRDIPKISIPRREITETLSQTL